MLRHDFDLAIWITNLHAARNYNMGTYGYKSPKKENKMWPIIFITLLVACWIISPFVIRAFDPMAYHGWEFYVVGLIWLFGSQVVVLFAIIIWGPIAIGKLLNWKS